MAVNIIVAVGRYVKRKGHPIGKDGKIPWHNSNDLKWFKETTMGHPVIMGRKTWDSLPKALPGRINIVVGSSTIDVSPRDEDIVYKVSSVEAAIDKAKELSTEDIFIIGGASIYKYALEHELVDYLYIDYIDEECQDADTFFPFDKGAWEQEDVIKVEEMKAYAKVYSRCHGKNNHVDDQYLRLVNDIITNGEEKDTRAGKTRSVFGRQLRFNLKEGLPILTTKKVFTKGIIYELLWFLKGDTNIKYLVDNGVHIWDDDAYRYYLELVATENEWRKDRHNRDADGNLYKLKPQVPVDKEEFLKYVKLGATHEFLHKTSCALDYYEYHYGDLSRVYGAQWTNWGGHNQVQEVIDKLKTNPDDRRMIISAWNVDEIPDMALPPCHYCCQFYTKKMTLLERRQWRSEHLGMYFCTEDSDEQQVTTMDKEGVPTRKLSCMFHMRSNDIGAGTSFNWGSYAILTHMIAQCCNMDVDELIYEVGDAHIYENHIEILKEQLERNPYKYALPKLVLNPKVNNIFDFRYEDIKIVDYESYPSIKLPLNVGL